MCFDRGSVVRVGDARLSSHHRADVDRTTGYGTRSMLCAPIMDDDGHRYGVIQLLNPAAGTFGDRDMAVIDNVSRSVGALLAEIITLD
jgi:GAF domain-containing protein